MIGLRVAIVFAACLAWSLGDNRKYCSLCSDHTMCKYKGVSPACKNGGSFGVSESQKKEIVDLHNKLRRLVATGKESRGVSAQPKAANLRKMVWDNSLAEVAQRWADQCQFGHDTCRKDPRWHVGQNIFWRSSTPKKPINWTETIMSWYDEVAKFNPKEIEKYRFDVLTGHYTQVLWHESYAIGCGAREYGNELMCVCNYGPAGNVIGHPMYTKGEPCSSCPKGTTCEDSLCVGTGAATSHRNSQGFWGSNTISEEGGSSPLEGGYEAEDYQDLDQDLEIDEKTKQDIAHLHDHLNNLLYTFLREKLRSSVKACQHPPPN